MKLAHDTDRHTVRELINHVEHTGLAVMHRVLVKLERSQAQVPP